MSYPTVAGRMPMPAAVKQRRGGLALQQRHNARNASFLALMVFLALATAESGPAGGLSPRATPRSPFPARGRGRRGRGRKTQAISPQATPLNHPLPHSPPHWHLGGNASKNPRRRPRSGLPAGDGSAIAMTGRDAGRGYCPLPTCTSGRKGGEAGPEGTEPRKHATGVAGGA